MSTRRRVSALSLPLLLSGFRVTAQDPIHTFAGSKPPQLQDVLGTTTSFADPSGITTDPQGRILFQDSLCRIHRYNPDNGRVTTIAGNGECGALGDNGSALSAQIRIASDITVDASGNIYFGDGFGRVRRIGTNGIITTVAGAGIPSYNGDGIQATQARLNEPYGVAVDTAGNVYIADSLNHRIRKIETNGIISTIAGTGVAGYSGDTGPASSARVSLPWGLVFRDGVLYFTDSGNHAVRAIAANGVITTVAGIGSLGFTGDNGLATAARLRTPKGIAFHDGAFYIADEGNNRIRRFTLGGNITTVAGNGSSGPEGDGGPATSAQLWGPDDVAVDFSGNVYVSDDDNNRIRRFTVGGNITTVAGNGAANLRGNGSLAQLAGLGLPTSVATDNQGNVFIADLDNAVVRRVSPTGIITTFAGTGVPGLSGDGGPATSARIAGAWTVATDSQGNVYIADANNHRIRKINTAGVISTFAGSTNGYAGDGGPATEAKLSFPRSVAVDAQGNVLIADTENGCIRKVDAASGVISTAAGRCQVLNFGGDGGPATQGQMSLIYGVTADSAGNIYISDTGNHRIRKVSPQGILSTFAGTGVGNFFGEGIPAVQANLQTPRGLTVDSAGNVYIADRDNHRIRKVGLDGIITTAAGIGGQGFSGDGGPPTDAFLNLPSGVGFNRSGNLMIADTSNNRVRRIGTPSPGPTITAPSEGQTIEVSAVSLAWNTVAGSSGYEIQVVRADGATVFSGQLLGSGSTSTVVSLPVGAFYFLLRACTGGFGNCGTFSVRSFSVALGAPTSATAITTPANGATLTTSTHPLGWTAVNGATSYQVTLRNNTTNTVDLLHTVAAPDTGTVFSMRSGQYTLEVRACSATCGPVQAINFTVQLPAVPTGKTTITPPALTSQSNQNLLTLNWSAVTGADLYVIRVVQPTGGPGNGPLTVASRQVSGVSASFVVPNGRAFVLIAACNGDGCGPNSDGVEINPTAGNPTSPILGEPVAGLTTQGPSIFFSWTRIPGDNGSNTTYRLYVQDFARQRPALDVQTTANFYAAQFAAGKRYDALVIANPNGTAVTGPAQGFATRGNNPASPTMVEPRHNGQATQGNTNLGWTPLPGAELYQYFVAINGDGSATASGVTTGTEVRVPLPARGGQPTDYSGIVRACTTGTSCVADSDTGWGPWSNAPGGTGVTNFRIVP